MYDSVVITGRTTILSATEREQGLALFMRYITFNGLGVFLLNNTVVSLMAIHFGASNLELGYINAAFHVTGVVSLLVTRVFRGVKVNKLYGWAWMVRGLVALLYGLLFVLSGPVARFTILVIFTGFCVSRAVGVSVGHAVQRDVMRDRDVGSSTVRFNLRLGYAQLISQLLAVGLLAPAFFDGIGGLVMIAYVGAIMNTFASLALLKIPGRSVVEHLDSGAALRTTMDILRERRHAIPLLVHVLGMGVNVLFAFQVVFIRRVLGMPPSVAVLFTVFGALAAIAVNLSLRPFADEVGERSLLTLTSIGLVVVALVWTFIPPTLPVPVYFVLGFLTFFFLRSLLTLKSAALIKSIPDRNRIPYTSTANVLLGVTSITLGLIGGALADVALLVPHLVMHEYSLTFLFTAMIAAVVVVLSARLPGSRNLSLRETADIMLSRKNLRAFLYANQLDFVSDPVQRETLLLSLERSATPVATSRLRQRLRGPSVAERERVLRSLFRSPRVQLLEEIVQEARDTGSYTRRDAIFCLGAYPTERSETALREIVAEGEERMRAGSVGVSAPVYSEGSAIALKSLARLECGDVLPIIRERLSGPLSPRAELDLAVAEAILDPEGPQLRTLFARAFARESVGFAIVRLTIAFNRLNLNPTLEFYFRTEASAPGRGLSDLLEDASEFHAVLAIRDEVLEAMRVDDHLRAWESIQGVFREVSRHGPYRDGVPREDMSREEMPRNPSRRWVDPLLESAASAKPSPGLAPVAVIAALYLLQHVLDATTS